MKQGWHREIYFGCSCAIHYVDGLIHNDNGPAIEFSNGVKEWFKHGKLHREDGPAIEANRDSSNVWWYNGDFLGNDSEDDNYSQEKFELWKKFKAFM